MGDTGSGSWRDRHQTPPRGSGFSSFPPRLNSAGNSAQPYIFGTNSKLEGHPRLSLEKGKRHAVHIPAVRPTRIKSQPPTLEHYCTSVHIRVLVGKAGKTSALGADPGTKTQICSPGHSEGSASRPPPPHTGLEMLGRVRKPRAKRSLSAPEVSQPGPEQTPDRREGSRNHTRKTWYVLCISFLQKLWPYTGEGRGGPESQCCLPGEQELLVPTPTTEPPHPPRSVLEMPPMEHAKDMSKRSHKNIPRINWKM